MAGFGGKGKRDAPKDRSTAPSSMIEAVGLIAQGDRAVPVMVQARTPVAPGAGTTSSCRSSWPESAAR